MGDPISLATNTVHLCGADSALKAWRAIYCLVHYGDEQWLFMKNCSSAPATIVLIAFVQHR
jgi:hypothetical protein